MSATARWERAATPVELLDVAERLFAGQGVENVALSQIVTEAGQKNRSAVHYYFGSRDGVLTAVLNRRLAAINARREARLDALDPMAGVAEVLRAATTPLAEVVVGEPWGADYMAVLAQVMSHPQLLGREALDNALLTGVRRTRELVRDALPGVPAEVVARRLGWFNETVVSVLARWVRETPADARAPQAAQALIDQVVAYGAGGVAAPSSPSEE